MAAYFKIATLDLWLPVDSVWTLRNSGADIRASR
jgi:hypothetical protein